MSYWNPSAAQSTYHSSPFARSLIQRVAPYNAYPTPPPASYRFSPSSSSLAGALGSPSQIEERRRSSKPSNSKHSVAESGSFFDDFLKEKARNIPEAQSHRYEPDPPAPTTPLKNQAMHPPSTSGNTTPSSLTPLTASDLSPKKRKQVEVVIDTPSKRRPASQLNFPEVPSTPSVSSSQTTGRDSLTPLAKPKMQCYVEITTPKSWTTPKHLQLGKAGESSPDLGGYGTVEDEENTVVGDPRRSTGKKTGDRDERGGLHKSRSLFRILKKGLVPLEKLVNLIEDIFEAEDTVSMDVDSEKMFAKFFSKFSRDLERPALNHSVIGRLTKAIGKVSRPSKRIRLTTGGREGLTTPSSPHKTGGIADIETQTLGRILKILERGIHQGETTDPFGSSDSEADAPSGNVTSKSGVGADVHGSPDPTNVSPDGISRPGVDANLDSSTTALENDITKLESSLEMARDSIVAADCCVALLTSDRLPKQASSTRFHWLLDVH